MSFVIWLISLQELSGMPGLVSAAMATTWLAKELMVTASGAAFSMTFEAEPDRISGCLWQGSPQ
ncbi:hypothetical protein ASE36_20955 [Rhizobium sp. Root274]|nr:hypothetical protein ASE36_20955 [Rhizobium sp. Root274]